MQTILQVMESNGNWSDLEANKTVELVEVTAKLYDSQAFDGPLNGSLK